MDYSQIVLRRGLAQAYSPQELYEKFKDYVQYNCTQGILWTYEVQSSKDGKSLFPVPHIPPLTVKAFCLFAGVSNQRFLSYMNPGNPNYEAYHNVAEYISDYCAVNVLNGAAVGAYNAKLAADLVRRDFNLEDDPTDARNVGKIEHEIVFTDYEELPADEPARLAEHDPSNDIPQPQPYVQSQADPTYDHRPPKHSGHFDMRQTMERNGVTEEP